ncbi:MAG TPA: hypothetical protein DGT23_30190, partial [Micromonosporaceae bacterium]|nr:hypothetical protein [Micromonosporaceae bacterium]
TGRRRQASVEEVVLGMMMLNKTHALQGVQAIHAGAFTEPAHRQIVDPMPGLLIGAAPLTFTPS